MRVKFIFVFDKVVGHGKNATPLSKNCLEKAEDGRKTASTTTQSDFGSGATSGPRARFGKRSSHCFWFIDVELHARFN